MVPISEYKTLDIKLDKVNSYIPPIVVNEADNNGRRLKFTPTYEGQPVTGITSARMYYDPRPRDASSIGDYVDGTKDGDGWVFVIPPNTFTANVQGIASVSFTDADGETYTRSMPIYVESGGTKATSQGTRIDKLVQQLTQMLADFTMTAEAETGEAGSQANVTVTKMNGGSYNLEFVIPRGDKGDTGDAATIQLGTVTTGNPGTKAEIINSGTENNAVFNFTIPRGDVGPAGVNENVPLGTASGVVAQAKDAYPALPRKVQVHGATSGVNTVEPTKLEAVGKNLIYGWEKGTLSSTTGNKEESRIDVRSSPSRVIPGVQYTLTVYKPSSLNKIRYYGFDGTYLGFNLVSNLTLNVAKSIVFTVPENVGSMRFVFTNTDTDKFTEMLPNMDSVVQLEYGSKSTQWSLGQMTEINLPPDISLADGDTLTIDRDGTTQIVHTEGEPTVLENVTLPELPAPTFNAYTTGGYIQPTVDVDYEKDVNLVLEALEAKIAALQVAGKTN